MPEAALPGRRRQLTVLLGTAAAVFVLDHVTKWLVTTNIALGDQVPSSGPVTLHHIENRGAAFGLFPQMQFVFLAVAGAVALYILFAGRRFGPTGSTGSSRVPHRRSRQLGCSPYGLRRGRV